MTDSARPAGSPLPGIEQRVTVETDRWRHELIGTAGSALSVAVRGERTPDGGALVHVVMTTSPHRAILRRDSSALQVAWHTTPLWHPSIGTLAVPE